MPRLNLRLTLFISFGLVLILLSYFFGQIYGKQDLSEVVVHIGKGDTAAKIAKELQDKGIIRSAESFRILARLRKADRNLKPGSYVFGGRSSLWDAVSRLEEGSSDYIRITIPEGWSLKRTLMRIDAMGLASYDSLFAKAHDQELVHRLTGMQLKSLEGFLYPETYFFPIYSEPDSILAIMVQEFYKKLTSAQIEPSTQKDFYKTLILASIVEKEAGNDSERELIAAVFKKRLKLGMPLQSCPTVDYILEERNIRRPVLTQSDINIRHPYNTYQNIGLPPGPICSPQLKSIQAALNPKDSPYLYFFADGKGGNIFSESFGEHERKQRQLRLNGRK